LVEEFFEQPFEIVHIEPGVTVIAAPEQRLPSASQSNRQSAFFQATVGLAKNAPEFEQRNIVVLMRNIMPQAIQQTREQTWTQDVHVAAEWMRQGI
jgi:hypothetical protein